MLPPHRVWVIKAKAGKATLVCEEPSARVRLTWAHTSCRGSRSDHWSGQTGHWLWAARSRCQWPRADWPCVAGRCRGWRLGRRPLAPHTGWAATSCLHPATTDRHDMTTSCPHPATTDRHDMTTSCPHPATTDRHDMTTSCPHPATTDRHDMTTSCPHPATTDRHDMTTSCPHPATTDMTWPPAVVTRLQQTWHDHQLLSPGYNRHDMTAKCCHMATTDMTWPPTVVIWLQHTWHDHQLLPYSYNRHDMTTNCCHTATTDMWHDHQLLSYSYNRHDMTTNCCHTATTYMTWQPTVVTWLQQMWHDHQPIFVYLAANIWISNRIVEKGLNIRNFEYDSNFFLSLMSTPVASLESIPMQTEISQCTQTELIRLLKLLYSIFNMAVAMTHISSSLVSPSVVSHWHQGTVSSDFWR